MTERKRSNSIMDDRETKKSLIDPVSSLADSFTQLDDLSNELFFEIFDYLDFDSVYQAFSNLNIRFQNLLHGPDLSIKINLSSISKSAFEQYHTNIILPHQHRIQSIQLSNPLIMNQIFPATSDILKFTRLENLSLRNIEYDYLENLLIHFASLPSLTSLTIKCLNDVNNRNLLYDQIFSLPKLKYCKLSIHSDAIFQSLSSIPNKLSSIESLTISSSCHIEELQFILSYLPQIRRLSVDYLYGSMDEQMNARLIVSNHLTHVSLNVDGITCNEFQLFVANFFPQVQVLYISTNENRTYLDAKSWEELISSYLPLLRIFDIEYEDSVDIDDQIDYEILINQFRTPFWLQHRWFFTYRIHRDEDYGHFVFYSTNPYRRKQYAVGEGKTERNSPHNEESSMNSVHHVDIEDEKMMFNCKHVFPNATDLTLRYDAIAEDQYSLPIILARILPLKQLTYLSISCQNTRFEALVNLLHFLPHLHTFVFYPKSIQNMDLISIRQNETFRIVSDTNNIRKMIIKPHCTFEQLQILIYLCPRLQELSLRMDQDASKLALQFLLSKTNEYTRQLHLLCMTHMSNDAFELVKTFLGAENLTNVSATELVEFLFSNIYLWW